MLTQFLNTLEMLETMTLDYVMKTKSVELGGRWLPFKEEDSSCMQRYDLWEDIRKKWLSDSSPLNIPFNGTRTRSLLNKQIEQVNLAVKLELAFNGVEHLKWRLPFIYKDAFNTLKQNVIDIYSTSNSMDNFINIHIDRFNAFREEFDSVNVFVSINYKDSGNELCYIKELLENTSIKRKEQVRFHFASDRNWIPDSSDLLDNTKFYMLACHAALFFFTLSNFEKRGIMHNPNVSHELGLMQGLGKRNMIIKHKKVKSFTNVRGLLHKDYKNTSDIKEILNEFLRDYLDF